MPRNSAGLMAKAFAVYTKDIRLEFRTRNAINAILMFGITTLFVVSFTLRDSSQSPKTMGAIFWIILFFSAMSGLAQTFIREEEAGTSLALKLTADPTAVYLGKLFFNISLLSIIALIVTPLFFMFTDVTSGNVFLFMVVLILGILGLCSATTIVAAIISKASVKGALFAVVAFPILFMLLMPLVGATEKAFDGQPFSDAGGEIQLLAAYIVLMTTGSLMLFKFVWQE